MNERQHKLKELMSKIDTALGASLMVEPSPVVPSAKDDMRTALMEASDIVGELMEAAHD